VGQIASNGTVNNCVALNANIAATGANFGRVAGSGGLTNSYARSDMKNKNDDTYIWYPVGNNTKNGENITEEIWRNKDWWINPAGFGFVEASDGAWDWPADKSLPILKGIPANVQEPKVKD
jgi:hypothetical protein